MTDPFETAALLSGSRIRNQSSGRFPHVDWSPAASFGVAVLALVGVSSTVALIRSPWFWPPSAWFIAAPQVALIVLILGFCARYEAGTRELGLSRALTLEARRVLLGFGVTKPLLIVSAALLARAVGTADATIPAFVPRAVELQAALADGHLLQATWLVAPLLLTVLISPVIEEILFTGIIFAGIYTRRGFPLAAAATGTAFVACHLVAGAPAALLGLPAAVGLLFLLQVFSVTLYAHTRSLFPSVAFHLVANLVTTVYFFAPHI